MNWQDAQDACRNKFDFAPGRLFEPRIPSMNEAVWKAAEKKIPKYGSPRDSMFWLGMNDLKDGTYRYISDGNKVVEGMWRRGQPKDEQVHCVGYKYSKWRGYISPGEWFDNDCSERIRSICVSVAEGVKEGETGDYLLFIQLL